MSVWGVVGLVALIWVGVLAVGLGGWVFAVCLADFMARWRGPAPAPMRPFPLQKTLDEWGQTWQA